MRSIDCFSRLIKFILKSIVLLHCCTATRSEVLWVRRVFLNFFVTDAPPLVGVSRDLVESVDLSFRTGRNQVSILIEESFHRLINVLDRLQVLASR